MNPRGPDEGTGPMIRRLTALLALILLLASAASGGDFSIPDWRLDDVNGESVSLHELLARGPVVLSFWALWCSPCLKELPHLQELAADYAGELTVVAVNADSPRSVHKVAPFVAAQGWDDLLVLLDTAGDVRRTLQVGGTLPFLLVLDSDGAEVYRHTGYREGDELLLREQLADLDASRGPAAPFSLQVAEQFEYSYGTDTALEIAESWTDLAVSSGDLRLGVLLNARQPSEEGLRSTELAHRWLEFRRDNYEVRAGHVYGLFGRGLLFAAYEDRTLRVDTALDGLLARWRGDRWRAAVVSGTPSALDLDVRGLDVEVDARETLRLGGTVLTWQPETTDQLLDEQGGLHRDVALSGRIEADALGVGLYAEYAGVRRWEADDAGIRERWGHGFYAGLTASRGPLGTSFEFMDYDRFTILDEADGRVSLNNAPSLTREHLYTLLNRDPYLRNADDETGWQLEQTWSGPSGWSALANVSRIGTRAGERHWREVYGHLERDGLGPFHVRAGFDVRDVYDKNLFRDERFTTVVGEILWHADAVSSWSLKVEQQHVEDSGTEFGGFGAFDRQFFTLEYSRAPRWSLTALLETDNKYDAQRETFEDGGPYPALQATLVTGDGSTLNLWAGKRLGGYLCAGGVCKYEPAFEGVEFFGTLRY